jgi:pimeloyl-ACP methyl ester carboxylesterase
MGGGTGVAKAVPIQAHYLPRDIRWGRKSLVYWATAVPSKLVVFVHGFGGSPTSTWDDFPSLLPAHGACASCDLVFFGYDSMRTRVRFTASALFQMLEELATNAAGVANRDLSMPRPQFAYQSIVLVAHSLGAVVARRALLDACQQKRPWTTKTKLVLFAPAHMGADVILLLKESIFEFAPIRFLAGVLQFRYPTLRDVDPNSATLRELLQSTTELLPPNRSKHCLKAVKVIFGERENIVDPTAFARDPAPVVIPNVGHTAVCKPSATFVNPLEEVLPLL